MSKSVCKEIQQMIRDYNLIEEITNIESENGTYLEDDFYYAEFYLIKKWSLKYGFDLRKIKESKSTEEYTKNIEEELKKIPYNSILKERGMWNRYYLHRNEVFKYIDSLKLQDFDIHVPSYPWLDDPLLSKYINYQNTYYVLSVFNTFYDEKISKSCSIDVITHTFQTGNIDSHKARFEVIDNLNYHFIEGTYPTALDMNKKYDLIVFNMETTSLEAMDRESIIYIGENGGYFAGNEVLANIEDLGSKFGRLTTNGMAIVKVPFTLVSNLSEEILEDNIVDKIVFLPKEKSVYNEDYVDTINVYIIIKKNKDTDGIEFINEKSGEKVFVPNKTIKKHHGCINMNIYTKHNPMLEKIYSIKADNEIQINIIANESKKINKDIDELDFD